MKRQYMLNPGLLEQLEDYQIQITLLCQRFHYAIDEFDILGWLKNFQPSEWQDALTVLSMVEYLDNSEIIEAYNYCLGKILNIVPEKVSVNFGKKIRKKKTKLIVIPLGELGKSGSGMIYFLRKTKTFSEKKHRFEIVYDLDKLSNFIGSRYSLLFIDDYFGSGGSAVKFYEKEIQSRITEKTNSYWISIVSQEKAITLIQNKIPNCTVISWKSRDKVFLRNRSPFGSYDKVKLFRDLCYKYGVILDYDNPLGYDNTQGMITFSYGAPNNLLPIFWSSNKQWRPIFPRYSKDRMAQARQFRKETAYWLSLARILNPDIYNMIATGKGTSMVSSREFKFILRTDFQLFCTMRMIKQKRPKPVICQILNLSSKDYEEILNDGQKRKVINNKGILTDYGEKAYQGIAKRLLATKLAEAKTEVKSFAYIPQTFRGIT